MHFTGKITNESLTGTRTPVTKLLTFHVLLCFLNNLFIAEIVSVKFLAPASALVIFEHCDYYKELAA